MKCPVYGAAELTHDMRDIPYSYKGESTTIPMVTGAFCPACDEVVLNREHGDCTGQVFSHPPIGGWWLKPAQAQV